jgi:hypothetical protein
MSEHDETWSEVDRIREHLSKIIRFRGSLQEYERWKGYECEILGPSYIINDSRFNFNDRDKEMVEKDIEAIVNWYENIRAPWGGNLPIGLPLRKKVL